jgi:hypothetical protein
VPPITLPASSFSVDVRGGRVEWMAGATPNSSAVISEAASANSVIRASGEADNVRTASANGGDFKRTAAAHHANATPSTPPAAARTRLSTIRCLTIAARLAPSASLMATSFWRAAPRASSRLATFAGNEQHEADHAHEHQDRRRELLPQVGAAFLARTQEQMLRHESLFERLRSRRNLLDLNREGLRRTAQARRSRLG